MIPDVIRDHWDALATLPGTYIKLCGAGGGGYFLVISTSPAEDLSKFPLLKIAG
jgi:hypothetical protein